MNYVRVTAEVDIDDVLRELGPSELRDACQSQGVLSFEKWSDVRAALLRGDLDKAQEIIGKIADDQVGILLPFERAPLRSVA